MKIKNILKLLVLLCLAGIIVIGCKKKDKDEPTPKVADITSIVVSPDWLKSNLDATNILVIDARGSDSLYSQVGHIPGAILVGMGQFDAPNPKGFMDLTNAAALSTQLAALGISKDKAIVVYADNVTSWGADGRILWMLRMAGFSKSALLDGGINYWTQTGNTLSKVVVTPTATTTTTITYDSNYVATTDYIKNHLSSIKIIDSRTVEEYHGAQLYGEPRGGHLPGAISLPYTNVFDSNQRLKSQTDLVSLFNAAGVTSQDIIVTYCTAGFRSAHLAMILRYAGFPNARNYDASFIEWASDTTLQVIKP